MSLSAEIIKQTLKRAMEIAQLGEYENAKQAMEMISETGLPNDNLRTQYLFTQSKIEARGDAKKEALLIEEGLFRNDLIKEDILKYLVSLYLYDVEDRDMSKMYCEKVLVEFPKTKRTRCILEIINNHDNGRFVEQKMRGHRIVRQANEARIGGNFRLALKLYLEVLEISPEEKNIWHGLTRLAEVYPLAVNSLLDETIEQAAGI